ncbi:MAG: disulfide bond formation protein B [Methylococcaceae bacterium]|nr:disulfide bond formation protein B [Methylococcaceae bacterium]
MKFNPRIWFFLGFISCFLMLSTGAFFQFIMELEPCPLCISQRIAILILGIVFLMGAIHNPLEKGIKIYAILGMIAALAGGGISIRHVWIQNLPPDEVPECGPGLGYIFENFPIIETLKLMLNGTGECADVLWSFLGLSIPAWTLVAFLFLGIMSLVQIWNKPLNG